MRNINQGKRWLWDKAARDHIVYDPRLSNMTSRYAHLLCCPTDSDNDVQEANVDIGGAARYRADGPEGGKFSRCGYCNRPFDPQVMEASDAGSSPEEMEHFI